MDRKARAQLSGSSCPAIPLQHARAHTHTHAWRPHTHAHTKTPLEATHTCTHRFRETLSWLQTLQTGGLGSLSSASPEGALVGSPSCLGHWPRDRGMGCSEHWTQEAPCCAGVLPVGLSRSRGGPAAPPELPVAPSLPFLPNCHLLFPCLPVCPSCCLALSTPYPAWGCRTACTSLSCSSTPSVTTSSSSIPPSFSSSTRKISLGRRSRSHL